jgi:hypothetical protein
MSTVNWMTRKCTEKSGTPIHGGGFLAYCPKCKRPFAASDQQKAIDAFWLCGECGDPHSHNTIPNTAFSPERKLST